MISLPYGTATPLIFTDCDRLLPVMERVAFRVPGRFGLKATFTCAEAPGASVDGARPLILKSFFALPFNVMTIPVNGPVPLFITVRVCGRLLLPTRVDEKGFGVVAGVICGAGGAIGGLVTRKT